jgi:hypothetical protein
MKAHLVAGLLILSLTSCSMLTKQGRQERAYRNYVRKASLRQERRKVKYRRPKKQFFAPSEPTVTAQTAPESPESATTSGDTTSPTP